MDTNTLEFIKVIFTFLGLVVTTVVGYLVIKKQIEAAKEVKIVKEDLKKGDENTAVKLDTIHTLVNSQYGIALELNVHLSEAEEARNPNPRTNAAAKLARTLWEDHKAKQELVDQQNIIKPQVK